MSEEEMVKYCAQQGVVVTTTTLKGTRRLRILDRSSVSDVVAKSLDQDGFLIVESAEEES